MRQTRRVSPGAGDEIVLQGVILWHSTIASDMVIGWKG
jgi:hypothetical protein